MVAVERIKQITVNFIFKTENKEYETKIFSNFIWFPFRKFFIATSEINNIWRGKCNWIFTQ